MAENFQAFLAENAIPVEPISYVASRRFVDSNKEPIPWLIKPITSDECDEIKEACKRKRLVPGTRQTEVYTDEREVVLRMICKCVVYPNLRDEKLNASYGTGGAEQLVSRMLTPGEYDDLAYAVLQANNYETGMAEKIKKAKN